MAVFVARLGFVPRSALSFRIESKAVRVLVSLVLRVIDWRAGLFHCKSVGSEEGKEG
jgi:hypothetical protein